MKQAQNYFLYFIITLAIIFSSCAKKGTTPLEEKQKQETLPKEKMDFLTTQKTIIGYGVMTKPFANSAKSTIDAYEMVYDQLLVSRWKSSDGKITTDRIGSINEISAKTEENTPLTSKIILKKIMVEAPVPLLPKSTTITMTGSGKSLQLAYHNAVLAALGQYHELTAKEGGRYIVANIGQYIYRKGNFTLQIKVSFLK